MSGGIGHRRSSDPMLLWLWRRLAAAALIPPLAQEFPYGFWGFFVCFLVFFGANLSAFYMPGIVLEAGVTIIEIFSHD